MTNKLVKSVKPYGNSGKIVVPEGWVGHKIKVDRLNENGVITETIYKYPKGYATIELIILPMDWVCSEVVATKIYNEKQGRSGKYFNK